MFCGLPRIPSLKFAGWPGLPEIIQTPILGHTLLLVITLIKINVYFQIAFINIYYDMPLTESRLQPIMGKCF